MKGIPNFDIFWPSGPGRVTFVERLKGDCRPDILYGRFGLFLRSARRAIGGDGAMEKSPQAFEIAQNGDGKMQPTKYWKTTPNPLKILNRRAGLSKRRRGWPA